MSIRRSSFYYLLILCAVFMMALGASVSPLRSARRSSLETNAVGSCRAYCSAQTMYKRHDWDADQVLEYTPDLRQLCSTVDGNGDPIDLIDSAFASAKGLRGLPKHGYLFLELETINGKAIDWQKDYALCAIPAVYGRTGYRTFIVKADGQVWGIDLGAQSGFVIDYPGDPAADGWHDADSPPGSAKSGLKWIVVALLLDVLVMFPLVAWLKKAENYRQWSLPAVLIAAVVAVIWFAVYFLLSWGHAR